MFFALNKCKVRKKVVFLRSLLLVSFKKVYQNAIFSLSLRSLRQKNDKKSII